MEHHWAASCDECGAPIFQAGQVAPPGAYMRVDDESFRRVEVGAGERLPASYDGHIALYRLAASPCACQLRRRPRTEDDVTEEATR